MESKQMAIEASAGAAIGFKAGALGAFAVAVVSIVLQWPLSLGIDTKSTVLLLLSLFVTSLSLGTGRTTVLQGVVHLVLLATYLFTTIVP